MQTSTTNIPGVLTVIPKVVGDEHGWLIESYRQDEFQKAGILALDTFVQDVHSKSSAKGTVRGLHIQYDKPTAKLLRCTHGKGFVVGVDLRKYSPTFRKYYGHICSEENKEQVYFPEGFAVGFQALSDDAELQFKTTGFFDVASTVTLLWNDPSVGIEWPEPPIMISDKDKAGILLTDWIQRPEASQFLYLTERDVYCAE
jgi:dTDP-4-dehydrorhamnose 3,5-epimerase